MKKQMILALAVLVTASCKVWSAPTFSTPASSSTVVTFDASGIYVLQVSVSDGAKTTLRTTTITVNNPIVLGSLRGGTGSGIAGTTVVVPVTYSTGTATAAGLQVDIALPSGVSYASVAAGPAATAAGKSVEANVTGGVLRVIVFGLNQNTINTGNVALVTFRLDAALPTSVVPLVLSGAVATNAAGNAVALGPTVNGSINVTANAAPVVTVGPNQTITLPNTATVSASATDDGSPNPPGVLSYQWSVQ